VSDRYSRAFTDGDFAGYRVYFGEDGDAVVILLCGGTKKRQDATSRWLTTWVDHKKRKAEEVTCR